MNKTIDYGRNGALTLLKVEDFIRDNGLTEDNCILVNSLNFDDLILEYRQVYRESAPIPFYYLDVLITDQHGEKEVLLDEMVVDKVKTIEGNPG